MTLYPATKKVFIAGLAAGALLGLMMIGAGLFGEETAKLEGNAGSVLLIGLIWALAVALGGAVLAGISELGSRLTARLLRRKEDS